MSQPPRRVQVTSEIRKNSCGHLHKICIFDREDLDQICESKYTTRECVQYICIYD